MPGVGRPKKSIWGIAFNRDKEGVLYMPAEYSESVLNDGRLLYRFFLTVNLETKQPERIYRKTTGGVFKTLDSEDEYVARRPYFCKLGKGFAPVCVNVYVNRITSSGRHSAVSYDVDKVETNYLRFVKYQRNGGLGIEACISDEVHSKINGLGRLIESVCSSGRIGYVTYAAENSSDEVGMLTVA